MATTAKTQTSDLTPAARTALTNAAAGSAQGSLIPTTTDPEVVRELMELGLVGAKRGLTVRGGIMRDRIQTEDLDRLFG